MLAAPGVGVMIIASNDNTKKHDINLGAIKVFDPREFSGGGDLYAVR